jgi:hypothetical protein
MEAQALRSQLRLRRLLFVLIDPADPVDDMPALLRECLEDIEELPPCVDQAVGYLKVLVLGDVPTQSVAHLDQRRLKAVAMLQQVGEVFPGMARVGAEQLCLEVVRRSSDPDGEVSRRDRRGRRGVLGGRGKGPTSQPFSATALVC